MKKGRTGATTKAGDNGHQKGELKGGVCLFCSAQQEGAQAGNVLALHTETSLGTRETTHLVIKA